MKNRLCWAMVLLSGWLAAGQGAALADGFLWQTGAVPDALPVDPRMRDVHEAGGFRMVVDRSRAWPGERYVEVLLVLDERPPEGAELAWSAELADVPSGRALASSRKQVSAERALLSVDVRQHEVRQGRLRVELLSPGGRVGAGEIFVGAEEGVPAPAAGERVRVLVDRPEGAGPPGQRTASFGVPFPAGGLWDAADVRVVDARGRELPSQAEPAALWGREGAVRWLRVDAELPAEGDAYVERGRRQSTPGQPVEVVAEGGAVSVRVAGAEYVLAPGASPIKRVSLNGRLVASSDGVLGLYVVDQNGRTARAAEDNEVRVEASGPVAASVRFEGFYRTEDGTPLARHITRVEFFSGRPSASVVHTLVLTEDTNEVWFTEMGWEMEVAPGEAAEALFGVSPDDASLHERVTLGAERPAASLFQRDYVQFGGGRKHFQVLGLDEVGAEAEVLGDGAEMGDWGAVGGAGGGLLVSCRESARQHPKEIEARADRLVLRLFSPRGGDSLDFRAPHLVARWNRGGQIGEDAAARLAQTHSNAAGWAKTHEILFHPFGPEDGAEEGAMAASALHSRPVHALADPWWLYRTRAMGPLYPRDEGRFPEAEAFMAAAVDGYVRQGHQRDGQYGFVDYFAGPHYRAALGSRRFSNTYTVRLSAWLHYARSGERRFREFAEGTNRRFLDNFVTHWDAEGKIRGAYHAGHNAYPFYWAGRATYYKNRSLNQFLYDYYLTGYRRAGDFIAGYPEAIYEWWEPGIRTWYRLRILRDLWIAYAATWDDRLRVIIEDYMAHTYDPEGAVGVHRNAIPNRTTYKANEDTAGVVEGWEMHGDRRSLDLAFRLAEYLFGANLATDPLVGRYIRGREASLLYSQTGDPAIPAEAYAAARQAVTGSPGSGISAQYFRQEGFPYALSLVAEADADVRPAASWAAFNSFGYPASFVARKAADESLGLHVRGAGVRVETVGAMPRSQLVSVFERQGASRVSLPYDTPAGAYRVSPESEESALFASGTPPLVVHAPEYWRPAPSTQSPPLRIYFKVPEAVPHPPAIFFEAPSRLFGPDGRPFAEGETKRGWVALPGDAHGLWSFEADEHRIVRTRNLPPFFAFDDPAHYFEPDIEWESAPPPEAPDLPPSEEIFVRGRGRARGDMALHLDGTRHLAVQAGPPHPSGDGGQFLPHAAGTVEFILKPLWSSFDLYPDAFHNLLDFRTVGRDWHLRYGNTGQRFAGWQEHVFDAELWAPSGRTVCLRRAIVEKGQWMHIAFVWGREEQVDARRGPRSRLTVRVYVDGQRGRHSIWMLRLNEDPSHAPLALEIGRGMPGLVDGLRISGIRRYEDDFEPPASENDLEFDAHTRLLLRFNGDLEGQSSGWEGPLPEGAVKLR